MFYIREFKKIEKTFRSIYLDSVKEYGLSPYDVDVIIYLYDCPNSNRAKDVVEGLTFSKGLIAKAVKELCEKGYLRVEVDENDRRNTLLYLTDKSNEIMNVILKTKEDCVNFLDMELSQEEMRVFVQVMKKFSLATDMLRKGRKYE